MKNHTLKPLAFAALACAALAASAAVLPTGYTELGYIQGNGSDSRIVTDYTPDPSTDKIEAVVEFPTLDKPMAIWCARGATANTNTWSMLAMGSGDRLRFDYGAYCDCNKFFTSAPAVNTTYTITADRNMATLNGAGSVGYDFDDSFTEAGGPLVLFAAYAGGTGSNKNFWADYRLFSFKVWRSGALIHDFVPCKDPDGIVGMVDVCANPATLTVEGTFGSGVVVTDENISAAGDPAVRRINARGGYAYVFTNAVGVGTVDVLRDLVLVSALLVGGGGAGGSVMSGGGGGGGVIALDGLNLECSPGYRFALSVGAGGTGGINWNRGTSGGDTTLTFGGTTYTAKGGGAGGGWNSGQKNGLNGGCGGGGAGNSGSRGTGTTGQGFAGAAGGSGCRSAGGGGAGHDGYAYTTNPNRCGNGGEGVTNNITGAWVYYGGGGGGGGNTGASFDLFEGGLGGLGGGGAGGTGGDGENGVDGLGGGGGGSGRTTSTYTTGGRGGTGTVILFFKPILPPGSAVYLI